MGIFYYENVQSWGNMDRVVICDECIQACLYQWGDATEYVVVGEKIGGDVINLSCLYDMLFLGMTMNELIGYDLLRSSMRRRGQTDAL